MNPIIKILMERDGMIFEEAKELFYEAQHQLYEYLRNDDIESAQYICEEYFNLEPDYLMDLM